MTESRNEMKPAASKGTLPTLQFGTPAARVAAWIAEDSAGGAGDWEMLKAELDKDRLSSRKLFPK